jgi:hypothetical protein
LMEVILSVPDGGYFERTWWRLFWAYLMEVILSIPDGGYFEHTWWRLFWAYLMEVILSIPDGGYFEHTWWRLFWAYLMEVILSVPDGGYLERTLWRLNTHRGHYIWYLRLYWSFMTTTKGESFIGIVVKTLWSPPSPALPNPPHYIS